MPDVIVALRKESVDRNRNWAANTGISARSLSARRAWIEMEEEHTKMESFGVALRKESVDRNTLKVIGLFRNIVSLSARRAWIEICNVLDNIHRVAGRSPQGERG